MRENPIRRIWASGGAVVNGWLTIPSAFSAEAMAHQGYDALTIDMQHGVISYEAAVSMLQAISTTATAPVVRVPWLEEGIVGKMLDAGAYGLICPMVNTADAAERLVMASHYPPRGSRSYGPLRATLYGGTDYQPNANGTIAVLAMIETQTALDNLDEILAVEGLDAVYIGPADLSLALGCPPGMDSQEPAVVEAIDFVLRKSREAGVVAGIHNASPAYALDMIRKGFQLVTVGYDAGFMMGGAARAVERMRAGIEQGEGTPRRGAGGR